MILNKSQAEAVYSAMVALNNLGGIAGCTIPVGEPNNGRVIRVFEHESSRRIHVSYWWGGAQRDFETHEDQNAFAHAYGLE